MKIIQNNFYSFTNENDPIGTEKTIYNNLLKDKDRLTDEFNYVDLPIADSINNFGVPATQNFINSLENTYPNIIKKYVCQHIYVNYLNFFNNKVYTPHTLFSDTNIAIPHYNPSILETDFVPFNSRTINFSFIGAFHTHPIRAALALLNNNNTILIRETGNWHFEKNKTEQERYSNKYKEIMCNTKFSLCPPGTGVSTIRLYESMAAGSIPVVFNNVKVPKIVEKYVIRVHNIEDILNIQINDPRYVEWSNELKNNYWIHLSNSNFYKLLYD